MQSLRGSAEAPVRGLLCVLFLWYGQVPVGTGRAKLVLPVLTGISVHETFHVVVYAVSRGNLE